MDDRAVAARSVGRSFGWIETRVSGWTMDVAASSLLALWSSVRPPVSQSVPLSLFFSHCGGDMTRT